MDLSKALNPVLSFYYNTKAWVGSGEKFSVGYRVGEKGEWKELFAPDISHEIPYDGTFPLWSGWSEATIQLPQDARGGCANILRVPCGARWDGLLES